MITTNIRSSADVPMIRHLMFSVDHIQCAIPLSGIHIVLRMVQLTPSPENSHGLAGTVNVHGEDLPVYSVRTLFGLPGRPPRLTDKLIITQAGDERVALWTDEANVTQQNPVLPPTAEILGKGREIVPGICRTDEGILMIGDLVRFLSAETAGVLSRAVTGQAPEEGDDPCTR